MRTEKLVNLSALALFLSYVENFLPHPLPFLRFGLANIPMLIALGRLRAGEYLLLSLMKAICTSYISGTLLSPFLILSLSQSLISALAMLAVYSGLRSKVSLYGVSLAGSAASSLTQISLSSLLLGRGMFSLLMLMLIFSFFSSLITAYLAGHIEYDIDKNLVSDAGKMHIHKLFSLILIISILFAISIKNICFLTLAFALMVVLSLREKRRFKPLNYIALILISIFSSLLVPRGLILFSLLGLPISQISLNEGLRTGLTLSLVMIISLTFSRHAFSGGIISLTIARFFQMESTFYETTGGIKKKFLAALSTTESKEMNESTIKTPYFTSIIMLCSFILLKILEWNML